MAVSSMVFVFEKFDSSIVHEPFAVDPSSSEEDIDDVDDFASRASAAAADASSFALDDLVLRFDISLSVSDC